MRHFYHTIESTLSLCSCLAKCSRQYIAGIELVFHGFQHEASEGFDSSKFVQSSSSANFTHTIRSLLNDFSTSDPNQRRFPILSYLLDFCFGVQKRDDHKEPQSFIIMSDCQNAE